MPSEKTYKKNLYFDYASGAKIRFLLANCYENTDFPLLYLIRTKKLEFTIPKKMLIKTKTHVFIPLDYYRGVLDKFYHRLSREKNPNLLYTENKFA